MALTEDQVVRIRRFVGDEPSDADLEPMYLRYGTLKGVVLEILETRRANLLASPLQFQVVGEYGQNARYNVEFITKLIDNIRAGKLDPDTDDITKNLAAVTMTAPAATRR